MNIIETQSVKKSYGKGKNAVHALGGVSLCIKQGEFTAITGASGSGKSTLLNIIGGLDRPTEGKVMVSGTDIFKKSASELAVFRRRHIGFVFQFFNLVPMLTVEENVTLPVLMDGKKPDKEFIDGILTSLGIEEKRKTYPNKLSGGQQQRVAIARALAANPEIILADEPTGNLDSKTAKEVLELFTDVSKRFNRTALIVTHDHFVASRCSRVIEIKDGMIIGDTTEAEHEI